jgi:hypothetical protein
LEENIVLGRGFFTKVACMFYGMLQNMVQEYLFRSIVRGTVQSGTNLICEAMPGALEEKILIDKGRFTKVARMIYGMVQNMVQEHLFRSIVEGDVQSETDFICEAEPGAMEGNILRGKGVFTKIACMIYGMLRNMVQEYFGRSLGGEPCSPRRTSSVKPCRAPRRELSCYARGFSPRSHA